MSCGVYAIQNVITEKIYIGSSKVIERRICTHFRNLYGGNHVNPYLQASFNKHGRDSFVVEFLETCSSTEELLNHEQCWLDYFSNKYGVYNVAKDVKRPAGSKGKKFSKETKQRMREAQLGKRLSEEHKRKIGISKENLSDESRKRISEAAKIGWIHRKQHEIQSGKAHCMQGFRHTEESKLKMRNSRLAYLARKREAKALEDSSKEQTL